MSSRRGVNSKGSASSTTSASTGMGAGTASGRSSALQPYPPNSNPTTATGKRGSSRSSNPKSIGPLLSPLSSTATTKIRFESESKTHQTIHVTPVVTSQHSSTTGPFNMGSKSVDKNEEKSFSSASLTPAFSPSTEKTASGAAASKRRSSKPKRSSQPYTHQRTGSMPNDGLQVKGNSSQATAAATAAAMSPSASAAPSSYEHQRTSMRPWYLNIQEKRSIGNNRSHRRNRALQDKLVRTRQWSRQVREIVDNNETNFKQRSKEEIDELANLNQSLVQQQEIEQMRMEGIAAVFDLGTRAELKKRRQLQFVSRDQASQREIEESKQNIFRDMWNRSHARRLRVKDEFCSSWEVLNFYGGQLFDQAQTMIDVSRTNALQNLAKLRAQVPAHVAAKSNKLSLQQINAAITQNNQNEADATLTTTTGAVPSVFSNTPGIGVNTGAAGTTAAAAVWVSPSPKNTNPEAPSDFRFPPSNTDEPDNPISLRLPTSIVRVANEGHSGINPLTGAFDPNFDAASQTSNSSSSTGINNSPSQSTKADRNYTSNRSDLSLIHSNMTLVHTAAPQLNPSWVTLSTESAPKLLPRSTETTSTSPAYVQFYDALLLDLETLHLREHALDLLEQALFYYKQTVQINSSHSVWAAKNSQLALNALYGRGNVSNATTPAMGAQSALAPPSLKLSTPGEAQSETESEDDDGSGEEGDDPNDPFVIDGQIRTRLQDLFVDLECCNFSNDISAFRRGDGEADDDSFPALKVLAKVLLHKFVQRCKFYSRFYMEIHSPSQKNSWFAGFVMDAPLDPISGKAMPIDAVATSSSTSPLSVLDADFYDTSQISLALHSDGSTFVCGHSRRMLQPLHEATVVGIAIDVLHGTIHFTQDGLQPQIIFGLGASIYSIEEQRQQAEWICSQRLRPCFGLLGPKIKLMNVNRHQQASKNRERERARMAMGLDSAGQAIEKSKSQRARHALTAHSSLQPDGSDTFRDEPDSSSVPEEGNASSISNHPSHLSVTEVLGSMDPFAPHALHKQHNDGLIGWIIPKLSVNLGEFDFLYQPTGSNLSLQAPSLRAPVRANPQLQDAAGEPSRRGYNHGLGRCLPINTQAASLSDASHENDNSLKDAFAAYQQTKQAKLQQQATQQAAKHRARVNGGASQSPTSVIPISNLQDAMSDYKHRQTTQALDALDALREQLLARPSASDLQKQINEQKAAFFKSLTSTRLVSWSHFPPQSVRVQQAILKVQRIARKYIGFRARRALWNKLSRYATIIQRCYRKHRANKNKRFVRAILPIQKVWRGFKARRMVALLKKYNLTYAQANKAAVHIQSFIRMLLARKKVLVLAMVVQQKIEQIKGLVIFVQRMFRRKRQKKHMSMNKSTLASVLMFQSRIRGIRLRRMLAAIDPKAAQQLKVIAGNVNLKQRRYAAVCLIQRVYRGYLARKFVRVKKNVIERDCHRLTDCWRAYQLRQRVDRLFRGVDAEYLKVFFSALGFNGQELPQRSLH